MPQLPLTGRQSAANLAQRLGPAQLADSMATNCPQLLNPRACRSALCLRAAVSNPVRETSCNICEKMLHTLFKAESSSDSLVFANSYQRLSAFFFPKAIRSAELIWTRMTKWNVNVTQSFRASSGIPDHDANHCRAYLTKWRRLGVRLSQAFRGSIWRPRSDSSSTIVCIISG